jgi:hypothetical protein
VSGRVQDMGEIDAPPPKVVTLEIGTHDLPHLIKYSSLYPERCTLAVECLRHACSSRCRSSVERSVLSEVLLPMRLAFALGDGAGGGRARSPTVQERTEQQIQRIADNVEILVQHCSDWGPQVHTLVFGARPGQVGLCWHVFVKRLDGGKGFRRSRAAAHGRLVRKVPERR